MRPFCLLITFLALGVEACAQGVTPIEEIQGKAHQSPLLGRTVVTEGIVTKLNKNGFYLQSAQPDERLETSDALFVYSPDAEVMVGNRLRVEGRVDEWRPRNTQDTNLTITQIRSRNIRILSEQVELPDPVILNHRLRDFPETIKIPGSPFDPRINAVDFWESLEHMRVVIRDSMVIGPRNSYDQMAVRVAQTETGPITRRGGLKLDQFEANPARILVQLDEQNDGDYHTGDRIEQTIEGVLGYSFGSFKVIPSTAIPSATPATRPTRSAPSIPEQALSIASFNVENLSPQSPREKFAGLAEIIVDELRSPSIVGLQEIFDNSGRSDDGVVDADITLNALIQSIVEAGGPNYDFAQINPGNRADGGYRGGNIRNAFLYDPKAVTLKRQYRLEHRSFNASKERNFTGTRKPLLAEFEFGRKAFILINCHLNSKYGDSPNYGPHWPAVRHSERQRLDQARLIRAHVAQIKANRPQAGIVALGDFNDFEFSPVMRELTGDGNLVNLIETLPVEDRYTYIYQGMSQTLDHILVSPDLARNAGIFIARVNADKSARLRVSDHDPLLAWFRIR